MRTAIVLPSGSQFSSSRPNSMETVVRTLLRAGTGHDLRIFCDDGAADHAMGGLILLPPGRARTPTLIAALQDFDPEIVEYHQQVKQAVAVARRLPRAAHILYRHNAVKPPRHAIDRWRYGRRYDRMDGMIFVSEAERALFAETFPHLADRAWAVPNPIEAADWRAPPENREPLIAFAGRAMPEKGVDVICAALPAILDQHPDWNAVLMLNDWEEHRLWAEPHVAPLRRYGDRVRLLHSAPLAEVRSWMKRAAIALVPSTWAEPFGLTALEAHAAGAALVSSGRGGLREASGPHALYLNRVTPAALVAAAERLITHPEERLSLARAAQAYVELVHAPGPRAAQLDTARMAIVERARQRCLRRAGALERSASGVQAWPVPNES